MFCRRAWQRVAPLARRVFKPAPRNGAPARLMASGLPAGSFNTAYFVLCGGGLTAALVYAYKTINSDTERYESRLAGMGSTDKGQFEAPATEPAPAGVAADIPESVSAPSEEVAEVSADPEASPEEAAAEAVSEEPANEVAPLEAPGTAAEASEAAAAEDAAPPETPTAAHGGAGAAALDGGAPPAAA